MKPLKKSYAWGKRNSLDIILWVVFGGFLVWHFYPLLSGGSAIGWDTLPHMYLLERMSEFLKSGVITGYDKNWFAGFPAFTFYGPLPYILALIPHFLSLGTLNVGISFNIFLFFLPVFFLFSVYFTSRIWFDRKVAPYALICAFLFLTVSKEFALFGIGLGSLVYLGLFTNLFAISLMILFFGICEIVRKRKSKWLLILPGVILAMIILSHAMTTIFTGIIFAIYTLLRWKDMRWRSLIIFGISLLVSSFWLIPFLLNLPMSSGKELSMSGTSADPLFSIFPYLERLVSGPISSAIPALLLFVGTFVGVVKLIRTKKNFWPLAFLFTLIFLPRDYLFYIIDLPLHYYRFTAHVFALNIFVAGAGLYYLFSYIGKLKSWKYLSAKIVSVYFVLLALCVSVFVNFDLEDHKYYFDEFYNYEAAHEMMDYISDLNPTGRIFTKSPIYYQFELGSPHYFSTFLPMDYGLEVLPGLLAESSLSSEFILSTSYNLLPESLIWGNLQMTANRDFNNQDNESMVERLGLYGVEYLLVEYNDATALLRDPGTNVLTLEKEFFPFSLMKIKKFRPKYSETDYKPYLFVDNGGMTFKEFLRIWFKEPEIFDYPVIYTDKDLKDLPKDEIERIGGLIISEPKKSVVTAEEVESYTSVKDRVVFLNAKSEENFAVDGDVTFLKVFYSASDLADLLMKDPLPTFNELSFKQGIDEEMSFSSEKGVFINYSYFPRWKSMDNDQTVYWAAPTAMFVFGQGENELFYD